MSKPTILIVDDESFYTNLLTDILGSQYSFLIANCGKKALQLANNNPIDLILLDIMMPDIDGYEVCKTLKSHSKTKNIPVIFLTAKSDIENEVYAFEVGSVDYIIKPFNAQVVQSRVKTHLSLRQANQRLEKYSQELEFLVSERTIELTRDIVDKQIAFEKLYYLSNYDPLTQLPNRNLFNERLSYVYSQATRCHSRFALLLINLDSFKQINDALGYYLGDKLLQQCSDRLSQCLEGADTISHQGGDEFAVILSNIESKQNCIDTANTIISELSKPFSLEKHITHITSSIGISCYPENGNELSDFVVNAELAMKAAKEDSDTSYQFYTPQLTPHASHRLELEKDLHHAIEKNELYLDYQPIIDLKLNTITGAEALLRWHHSKHGKIAADKIISIAEESDLILKIGSWVIKAVCEQAARWRNKGLTNFHIAVNISPKQLNGKFDYIHFLSQLMSGNNLNSKNISIEVTENLIMKDSQSCISALHQLKETGITLSLDDFGTGYSSLSYLHRFPIDSLKIDRSFIQRINQSNSNDALIKTIITIGKNLNLKTIAEGIETQQQLDFLCQNDCELGQGYLFSKPTNAQEIEIKLKKQST